jgi:pimeloyl-ACP methyl ester carboxylesterase
MADTNTVSAGLGPSGDTRTHPDEFFLRCTSGRSMAEEMVGTFPDAHLAVVEDAGLFSHEERPVEVAQALLPVLAETR